MKLILACLLFLVTIICVMIYLVGMHGHFMFRPNRLEDWIIWGIAAISFTGGLILCIQLLRGTSAFKNK